MPLRFSFIAGLLQVIAVTPACRVAPEVERLPFGPRTYVAYRADAEITVNGDLDEAAWVAAPWSVEFVDIRGGDHPKPAHRTRVKMLWDEDFVYVAAELEEPDLWATLRERDSVIYRDNDFEVFIDPDGDSHTYYELEINALETIWDLMLTKPYRDGGHAVDAWDIRGLKKAVRLDGTLNDSGDTDVGWTVELAIPWGALITKRDWRPPLPGEQWRVNFSRVQWRLDQSNRGYRKRLDPRTKQPYPYDSWVWSPQGEIQMHLPERWGYVQFSALNVTGQEREDFRPDPDEGVKWALRQLYYRQREYRRENGRFLANLASLGADDLKVAGIEFEPLMQATSDLYHISAPGFGGKTVHIRHDGKVWTTSP